MDPTTKYNREGDMDIASKALEAAGATKVEPSAWCVMKVDGTVRTPLVGLDFVVY